MNLNLPQTPVRKAMVLAAGLGTRLKPFTNQHPKALALVNGKTLLQHNIEYLQSFGIRDVIVNTHHFAEQIEQAVIKNKGWGSQISVSFEQDVLETGGGLLFASQYFENEENFVLMNADVLTNMPLNKMIQQHLRNQPLATLAISNRNTSRYLLFTDDNELCGWRNIASGEIKMARHYELLNERAFSGIHVMNQKIFSLLQPLFSGKFSMIDVYLHLAKTEIIQGFAHDDYQFVDVGKPESIVVAEGLFR